MYIGAWIVPFHNCNAQTLETSVPTDTDLKWFVDEYSIGQWYEYDDNS